MKLFSSLRGLVGQRGSTARKHSLQKRWRRKGLRLEYLEDRLAPAVLASLDANNVLQVTVTGTAPSTAFLTSSASGISVGTTSGASDVFGPSTAAVAISISGSGGSTAAEFDGTTAYPLPGFGGSSLAITGVTIVTVNDAISGSGNVSITAGTININ